MASEGGGQRTIPDLERAPVVLYSLAAVVEAGDCETFSLKGGPPQDLQQKVGSTLPALGGGVTVVRKRC